MSKHIFLVYREKNRLTQAQLARRLGVSRGMVGLIEAGERSITAEKANAWAGLLGVSRGDLNPIFAESPVAGPSTSSASADTLNRELAAVGGLCEQVDSTLGAFERVNEASDAERLNRQMDALDKICDHIENPPAAAAGAATGRGSGGAA